MAYRIRDWDVSLTSATICLSYLMMFIFNLRTAVWLYPVPHPSSQLLPVNLFIQRTVPWLIFITRAIEALRISVNNTFAAPQHGQENYFVLVFALWCLAPRSIFVMEVYILATVFREKTSILTNVVYKP